MAGRQPARRHKAKPLFVGSSSRRTTPVRYLDADIPAPDVYAKLAAGQ
jgi:hypothetical protein